MRMTVEARPGTPAMREGRATLIAIEGSHSTGQLFLLELLRRRYDVREVHPFARMSSSMARKLANDSRRAGELLLNPCAFSRFDVRDHVRTSESMA